MIFSNPGFEENINAAKLAPVLLVFFLLVTTSLTVKVMLLGNSQREMGFGVARSRQNASHTHTHGKP